MPTLLFLVKEILSRISARKGGKYALIREFWIKAEEIVIEHNIVLDNKDPVFLGSCLGVERLVLRSTRTCLTDSLRRKALDESVRYMKFVLQRIKNFLEDEKEVEA